jgi:hypothetical protein
MGRRGAAALALMGLLTLAALLAVLAAGGEDSPRVPAEAHRYADGVLGPRFHAAFNEWSYRHPRDPEGREWEHCRRLDAGDVERWRRARDAFRDLDAALRRAGYR